MKNLFFLFDTEDLRVKLGFAAWLKTVAQKFELSFFCCPSFIELKDNKGKTVLLAGVTRRNRECLPETDFLSVLVDKKTAKVDKKLTDFLLSNLGTPTIGDDQKLDEEKILFIFDPLKEEILLELGDFFEDCWAQSLADFLHCKLSATEGRCFVISEPEKDIPLGMIYREKGKIVIETSIPFVAEGMAHYFFNESSLDSRFVNFFNLKRLTSTPAEPEEDEN